jgi:hypothetical protein
MGKYKFQFGGDDTSFFNQLATMYGEQQQQQEQFAPELPEEPTEDSYSNYDPNEYEDLNSKYEELLSSYNELSKQVQNMPNQMQSDDGFLNFLFSEEDNKKPLDFNYSDQSSQRGVNPFVKNTEKDLIQNYNLFSKGIWGDKAHQQRVSDHNTGDAEDFGFKNQKDAQSAIARLQSESKQRGVKYIIFNKQIWNPEISNEWRPYNGPNPHSDHIHVSYKRQVGGYASTPMQQYMGLNNPAYDQMFFPTEGVNDFRGLDNGQPVLLQDETGTKKILRNKYQIAKMHGNVHEIRL